MAHYEKELHAKDIFAGRVIDVKLHTVLLEDGNEATREVAHHNGGATVAALDNDGNLLMVRQYRFAVGQELLELPAGKLELGEDPYLAAMRELEEETGYATTALTPLTKMMVSPGYCSEIVYIYCTTELVPSKQNLDAEEFLTVERVPLAQAVEMVMRGEITDGKTQVGILMLDNLLKSGKTCCNTAQ